MKKITLIVGIIILIGEPIYLFLINKLNNDLLLKLSIDAGLFLLIAYNVLTDNFIKNKTYFINTFKNVIITLLLMVPGYSIIQSIFLSKNIIIEYIPVLRYTNSFCY